MVSLKNSDKELLGLNLYCAYTPFGEKGDKQAIPSFISMFDGCLEHMTSGYYGRDAYIVLEAVGDILVITMRYTHHIYPEDMGDTYDYKFYMDFTPNNQLHYACSCYFPDVYNREERPIISEKEVAHLFNCMSIRMRNEEMSNKGYYARFDVDSDRSIITLNDEHCTITEYIAEAFNVRKHLKPFSGSTDRLLPDTVREMAEEVRIKKANEAEEIRNNLQSILDKYDRMSRYNNW